jgi:hypothetical protein
VAKRPDPLPVEAIAALKAKDRPDVSIPPGEKL